MWGATYQEVKHAQSQHVKGETDVSVVIKPVQHLHTQVPPILCNGSDLLQHADLNLGRRSVLRV